MNVLFLLIAYPHAPQEANLYFDLVAEFAARGHRVHVATLLESRHRQSTHLQVMPSGVKVLRVRCGNLFGVGIVRKGLTTLSLPRRFMAAIDRLYRGVRFDLVVYPTPPITFAPLVDALKRRMGCHTYLILRDIFPQNARDLGMIRDPLTYAFFRRKEQRLYDISDHIGCMSQGNIDYVLAHNRVDGAKLEILYNWQRLSDSQANPGPAIRRKYALDHKYVAIFGGNVGYAQEMEFLLDLARIYRDRTDIVFLIVGNGVRKPHIANLVRKDRLTNVQMHDFIPRDDYNDLLAACDVGLVNLDRRFTIPNIPSKTLAYFAAGIPVLAAIDAATDYGRLLDECGAGLWSITGDLPAYQRNFERLANDADLRRRLGENGRRALRQRFSVDIACDTILRHFPA